MANAALFGRVKGSFGKLLDRSEPGEELASYRLWMLMGVKWFLSRLRSDPFLTDLASIAPTAPARAPGPSIRLAVVGDAGQLGHPQEKILRMIAARHEEQPFDVVIHLGDVYFRREHRRDESQLPCTVLGTSPI